MRSTPSSPGTTTASAARPESWRASSTSSSAPASAWLGSAQGRLQTLDDDYYVRGALTVHCYRSIRTRLEREVERLHGIVDRATNQRVLHPDPRKLWAESDLRQGRELVGRIVQRVEVMPARRGACFDPSRLRLEIPLFSLIPPPALVGEGQETDRPERNEVVPELANAGEYPVSPACRGRGVAESDKVRSFPCHRRLGSPGRCVWHLLKRHGLPR